MGGRNSGRRRGSATIRSTGVSSRGRAPASGLPPRRRARKKTFFERVGDFFSSNLLAVLIAGGVILLAGIALITVFVVVPAIKDAKTAAEPVYVEPVAPAETPEPEPTPEPVVEEPIISIGIILGLDDTEIMDGFGEYAQELITTDAGIDTYYIYTAGTDAGQQIQDTRSIINKGCKVLIAVGMQADTADIVAGLCDRAGIIVIGVESESPGRFMAEVKSAEAWYEAYSLSVQNATANGDLLLISDTKKSDFSVGVKEALAAISVTPESEIYYTPMTKVALAKAVEKAFKKKPEVMLVRGSRCMDFLTRAAKAGYTPRAVVSRATVGLLKTWAQLKGEGLITVEAVVPEEGDTKTEPVEEERAFMPDTELYAYAGLDGTMTGKTACRFAYNLAVGKTLKDGYAEYTVTSQEIITNENYAEYYELYKDAADEKNIPGTVDFAAIDALFTDAPAQETEAEDGV